MGRIVPDNELWMYCVDLEERGKAKLVIRIDDPAETSTTTLVLTLEKLRTVAQKERMHLSVNVITGRIRKN
ncbi:MAG: hypothetical protein L0241_14760 [Planctomycetia bacterium]|nr:hypothetical protein [Planctomycetia bacterium]